MAGYSQHEHILRVDTILDEDPSEKGFGGDPLLLVKIDGVEGISRLFGYDLVVLRDAGGAQGATSNGEKRPPIQVIATTHSPYLLDLYRDHPEEVVLAQILEGKSVRQIAEGLGRSPHTVHDHVKAMHRKLGASTRLTPETALEVCRKTESRMMISPSITDAGNLLRLGLSGTDCRSGAVIASVEQSATRSAIFTVRPSRFSVSVASLNSATAWQ